MQMLLPGKLLCLQRCGCRNWGEFDKDGKEKQTQVPVNCSPKKVHVALPKSPGCVDKQTKIKGTTILITRELLPIQHLVRDPLRAWLEDYTRLLNNNKQYKGGESTHEETCCWTQVAESQENA